jgi:hypothetical protein
VRWAPPGDRRGHFIQFCLVLPLAGRCRGTGILVAYTLLAGIVRSGNTALQPGSPPISHSHKSKDDVSIHIYGNEQSDSAFDAYTLGERDSAIAQLLMSRDILSQDIFSATPMISILSQSSRFTYHRVHAFLRVSTPRLCLLRVAFDGKDALLKRVLITI